jgi:hypothetical protein
MAHGDKTKEVAFQMWVSGKQLSQIQHLIETKSTTLRSSVKGWVTDWERGKQGKWVPKIN